jgi:hypothetical protein
MSIKEYLLFTNSDFNFNRLPCIYPAAGKISLAMATGIGLPFPPGEPGATIIARPFPMCRMAAGKKHRAQRPISLADALPDLLASALEKQDDLVLTCEIDPDTGEKTLHVMTGKLISGCMLNKLKTLIEVYPEDGGTIRSEEWT